MRQHWELGDKEATSPLPELEVLKMCLSSPGTIPSCPHQAWGWVFLEQKSQKASVRSDADLQKPAPEVLDVALFF